MYIYKVGICILFSIIQVMGHHLLSFNKLANLQKLNQNDFDSAVTNLGFKFSDIKYDEDWKSKRYIYIFSKSHENNPDRIEKVVDSVYFGKEKRAIVIITIDLITYERCYYNNLLTECKQNGYLLWGPNNYDREYPNMETIEYRKGASVAKFSISRPKGGLKFYKISVSISPK